MHHLLKKPSPSHSDRRNFALFFFLKNSHAVRVGFLNFFELFFVFFFFLLWLFEALVAHKADSKSYDG